MSTPYEEISDSFVNQEGRPDSNLSNDSKKLGGVSAEEYATKKYVRDYHDNKEKVLKEYIDDQDNSVLNTAKEYTNAAIRNQDFSNFAKTTDLQALKSELEEDISECSTNCKNYIDGKIADVVEDVNDNFDDVNAAITTLDNKTQGQYEELFTSVSNGKQQIAGAITDKGVSTSATATFSQMATNIRNIPQEGGGTDTSDATATPSDILNGKTAYVKGQKIYGRYIAPVDNQDDPTNPYPVHDEVEIIYANKKDEVGESENFDIPSSISKYAITCGGKMMLAYYSSENKFKILIWSENSYRQMYGEGTTTWLMTPEYSLDDLGIPQGSSILNIAFGKMNEDETFSRYDTMVAISTLNPTNSQIDIYIYRFTTGTYYEEGKEMLGKIYTENETHEYGVSGETISRVLYNKWLIETGETESKYCGIWWSPYTFTLAVGTEVWGDFGEWYKISLYEFEKYTVDPTYSDYGRDVLMSSADTGSGGSAYNNGGFSIKFSNNDRIISAQYKWKETTRQYIFVYDENHQVLAKNGEYLDNLWIISDDGLYGVRSDKLYSLIISYVTGTISFYETLTLPITTTGLHGSSGFSKNNTFLFTNNHIYSIDFIEKSIKLINASEYTFVEFLPDREYLRALKNYKNIYIMILKEQKEVVGLLYKGETYYKQVYPAGTLTAGQPDVVLGKTYIGYLGIPETGTMEVNGE